MKFSKFAILVLILLAFLFIFYNSIMSFSGSLERVAFASSELDIGIAENFNFTVVYDNYAYGEGLTTAWGFGCYITVDNVTILFDTGADPETLLENMAVLNLDVEEIDIIVLSHNHYDHVDGFLGVLELNSDVLVYLPASFPTAIKISASEHGCELIEVNETLKICNGVATTGELGTIIKEQSLMIATQSGLVVLTGCAHPGIVHTVEKSIEFTGMEVDLVVGGAHLYTTSESEILSIIEQLKALGVNKTALSHCTGDQARLLLKQEYGDDFIEIGVGFNIPELPSFVVLQLFIVATLTAVIIYRLTENRIQNIKQKESIV